MADKNGPTSPIVHTRRCAMPQFCWIPGLGPELDAIERMSQRFPQPGAPMGEAWFMGEKRRTFDALLVNAAGAGLPELVNALGEIASGSRSFGRPPEWDDWFHYLLPRLIPRANETFAFDSLLEYLVTAFVAIHPNQASHPPYEYFVEDALHSLGKVIMAPDGWHDGGIVPGRLLQRFPNRQTGKWGWNHASGDFSASMFFCLKFLPEASIKPWMKSVLAIRSPHWRAQVMVWFAGARRLFREDRVFPDDLESAADAPEVGWAWSHVLRAVEPNESFVDSDVRSEVLQTMREFFSQAVFDEWLMSISEVDYLETELGELPFSFWEQYAAP
jgi:hypothetical protein